MIFTRFFTFGRIRLLAPSNILSMYILWGGICYAEDMNQATNYQKAGMVLAFSQEGWRYTYRGMYAPHQRFTSIYDVIYNNASRFNVSADLGATENPEVLSELYIVGPNTPKKLLLADHRLGDGNSWITLSDSDFSILTAKLHEGPLYTGEGGFTGAGTSVAEIVEHARKIFAEDGGEYAILDYTEFKKIDPQENIKNKSKTENFEKNKEIKPIITGESSQTTPDQPISTAQPAQPERQINKYKNSETTAAKQPQNPNEAQTEQINVVAAQESSFEWYSVKNLLVLACAFFVFAAIFKVVANSWIKK